MIYLVFLVLAVPAALPPTFGDSVTYHLPYALDWANASQDISQSIPPLSLLREQLFAFVQRVVRAKARRLLSVPDLALRAADLFGSSGILGT